MFIQLVQSIKKNRRGIGLIILSALCTSVGQAVWKVHSNQLHVFLILGFLLYAIGALLMIFAFRYGSLSVLHPLLSLGYIFGLFIGGGYLDEPITYKEIIGTLGILCGVILVGGGED